MSNKIKIPALILLAIAALACFAKAAKAQDGPSTTPTVDQTEYDVCGGIKGTVSPMSDGPAVYKCDRDYRTYRYVYEGEIFNPSWTKAINEAVAYYRAQGVRMQCKAFIGIIAPQLDYNNEAAGRAANCKTTGNVGYIVARQSYFTPHVENCANQRHLAFHEVGHALGFGHTGEQITGYADPPASWVWMDPAENWANPGNCGGPSEVWNFPVSHDVVPIIVIDDNPATWTSTKRVQPKKCKRPKWRAKHRRVCKRGQVIRYGGN